MKFTIGTEQEVALWAAQRYVKLLNAKPNAVLGYATGSTPLGLYGELARLNQAGAMSFREVTTFNLDEYVGLDGAHEQSYRYFMNKKLFEKINIPLERTFVPSGLECSHEQAAQYDEQIKAAGGVDLQLLGIGNNGHIGFNEPGTPFGSITHKVKLTPSTRQANARFFASLDEVPAEAVSMGVKTVMNARAILFIALGAGKAEIVREAFRGPVTEAVPASVLQLHPDVEVFLDHAAAKLL